MQTERGEVDPGEVVVAVLGAEESSVKKFLGSGAIIGDGSLLLTADHVITSWSGELAIGVPLAGGVETFRVEAVERDPKADLALLEIHDYRPKSALKVLFDVRVNCNLDLVTLEYGTTPETPDGALQLNPATRIGHMTRHVTVEALGVAGIDALELSFPALRGASGAPVMLNSDPYIPQEHVWGVVGVVVANATYEALPAQITTALSKDNSTLEEVKYYLPQALAVNIKHLRPMYERAAAR